MENTTDPTASPAAIRADLVLSDIEDCVLGLDHVALAVIDLEQSVEWYKRVLGFKVLEERTTQGAHTAMRSVVMSSGKAVVVLLQGTTPQSQICRFIESFGAGVHHVALTVRSLDEVMARVSAANVVADTPMLTDEGLRQVFLQRDSQSGVRVELIERSGVTFSDTSVEELFRSFEAKELY